MNKVEVAWRRIKFLWVAVIVLIILQLLTGCEILKAKSSAQSSLKQASRQTEEGQSNNLAGSVSREAVDAKTVLDWWKTTYQFQSSYQPAGGDTMQIRNYINTPQPQVIIMEGGKSEQQTNTLRTDSAFYNQLISWVNTRFDTLSAQQIEMSKQKHSETKGVGVITLVLIGIGIVILNRLTGFLGNRYTITKKKLKQ